MFTGIITDIGTIDAVEQRGDLRVRIACGYDMAGVALGASIACSGVCLTVVDKSAGGHTGWFAVDVSGETVSRSADGMWSAGGRLNLERPLCVGDELGGHIVTGHVDGVGRIVGVCPEGASTRIGIAAPAALAPYVAAKGSIAIDGISLTVNDVRDVDAEEGGGVHFSVNIIPHTASATTLDKVEVGRALNLEIDILARYLGRMEALRTPSARAA